MHHHVLITVVLHLQSSVDLWNLILVLTIACEMAGLPI